MNLHQRASGVLLHVTSLPGPHDIGDFGPGARHFVDWLVSAGQRLWQWLPTTPIGPGHSPYQSVSAFAGSPLMVALEPLIERGWLARPALPDGGFDAQRVDFDRVAPWRAQQLRKAAAGFRASASAAERDAMQAWCVSQAAWLDDYALFMALQTQQQDQAWWRWPAPLARRDPVALARARSEHAEEIGFWQLRAVVLRHAVHCAEELRQRARRGDHVATCRSSSRTTAPIAGRALTSINSTNTSSRRWWPGRRPTTSARSAALGQPAVSLAAHGRRGLRVVDAAGAACAGACRCLSHRSLPRLRGLLGDPGHEPHCAGWALAAGPWQAAVRCDRAFTRGIADRGRGPRPHHPMCMCCAMPAIFRHEDPAVRFWRRRTHDYLPHNFARHVVAYTGTHDNDTARGWWDQASDRVRRFAGTYLACAAHDVHWAMIRALGNSVADLAIFPLQDVLGLGSGSRMNTPGTMGGDNWTWRFDWPMVGAEPGRVLGLITAASGRGAFALLGAPPDAA